MKWTKYTLTYTLAVVGGDVVGLDYSVLQFILDAVHLLSVFTENPAGLSTQWQQFCAITEFYQIFFPAVINGKYKDDRGVNLITVFQYKENVECKLF